MIQLKSPVEVYRNKQDESITINICLHKRHGYVCLGRIQLDLSRSDSEQHIKAYWNIAGNAYSMVPLVCVCVL